MTCSLRSMRFFPTSTACALAGVASLFALQACAASLPETVATPVADAGVRAIHEVQGRGDSSPLLGQAVTVEGIVVADFQGAGELKGFFLQEPDDSVDADPQTSEGLFVYDGGSGPAVTVGDRVRVSGTVREYNGLTELAGTLKVTVLGSHAALPQAVAVQLPLAAGASLERYEGMRVRLPQTLTVSETYDLGRYGQVLLSSQRLITPTEVAAPGDAARALQARNDLDRILLDDARAQQNPDPIRYPAPELSAFNSLRVGDRVAGVSGVLDQSTEGYRVQPDVAPRIEAANPRTEQPKAAGRMRVASFNVLNYFNGDGRGAGFPTARGASTAEEFQRQRAKVIAAILASRASVVGLMEIENDGYGADSAIADLVKGLNAGARRGERYAYIDPARAKLGSDAIAVGLVYRSDVVRPLNAAAVLDSTVDPSFDDTRNRPSLAQSFREIASYHVFTVAINHLKSKGSACDGDPDTGDGQGNCNLTRVRAANALVKWLAKDPTGSGDPDYLILGDLNAYTQEDPVTLIRAAGYTDLAERFVGLGKAYSFVFAGQSGALDHALASPSMLPQVRSTEEWHINADEPRVLDYNMEFKSARQQGTLYNADPYRASDHDPLVVGVDLGAR